MAHYHTLPDGRETGTDQIDPENVRRHFHFVNGEKTSDANDTPDHTHMIDGQLTGRPIEEDKKAMSTDNNPIQTKQFYGHVTEFKEESIDGVNVGIVEGYIATWDVDRGDMFGVKDQFTRGAFQESIADHLKRNRKIRFKDQHGRTVGGWRIDTVREDDKGLFGVAEINLDVQQGREAMSLIRQRVLTDFSIGFSVDDFSIDGTKRTITKATIWEGSIVDEPMNPFANVTGFKAVVPFQDLPLADRERVWEAAEAISRVQEFTESEDEPGEAYKNAFLWYDRENANTFGAYKLPIADVINGRLVAIPTAIFAAADALLNDSEGVDIPESDRPGVIRHIERYYAKLDMPSPFEENEKQLFVIDDVKIMAPGDLEKALRRGASFSKSAAKFLTGKLKVDKPVPAPENVNPQYEKLLEEIRGIKLK